MSGESLEHYRNFRANLPYLSVVMKRWLKYLLPVIVAAAFWNIADENVSSDAIDNDADFSIIESTCGLCLSETESEPCLPRQVSFTNSCRVQSVARRTSGPQRHNLEFTKAGKIYNSNIRYVIQTITRFTSNSLSEPSQRLLSLGRLII